MGHIKRFVDRVDRFQFPNSWLHRVLNLEAWGRVETPAWSGPAFAEASFGRVFTKTHSWKDERVFIGSAETAGRVRCPMVDDEARFGGVFGNLLDPRLGSVHTALPDTVKKTDEPPRKERRPCPLVVWAALA